MNDIEFNLDLFIEEEEKIALEQKILNPMEFEGLLENKILEIKKAEEKRVLLIALSGFSGVGKSTQVDLIKKIAQNKSIPVITIENNLFLKTESGSIERQTELVSSWRNYKKMLYDFEKIENVIKKICQNPGKKIIERGTYQRWDEKGQSHGKLDGETEFTIPEGKFLLLCDGVNSVEYAKKLESEKDVEVLKVFIGDSPSESLLRATFRNANKKKILLEEPLRQKVYEYFYQCIWNYNNLIDADCVLYDEESKRCLKEFLQIYKDSQGRTNQQLFCEINNVLQKFQEDKLNFYPKKRIERIFLEELIKNVQKIVDSNIIEA